MSANLKPPRVRRAALAVALGIVAAIGQFSISRAQSSGYDDSFFKALKWRSVGPVRGGRSIAAAGSPGRIHEYYFGAVGGGLWKSVDGGKTGKRALFRDAKTAAIDLAIDRRSPNVLYAALWEAYRVSWQMSSGGPGSGLYKSTDGGDTWTEITRNPGLPAGLVGRIGIAVSPVNSDRVWALIEAREGGVYRSDNAGKNWTRINEQHNLTQRAWYYAH